MGSCIAGVEKDLNLKCNFYGYLLLSCHHEAEKSLVKTSINQGLSVPAAKALEAQHRNLPNELLPSSSLPLSPSFLGGILLTGVCI